MSVVCGKAVCLFSTGLAALSVFAELRIGEWSLFPIYGGGCFKRVEMCPAAPNVLYTYVDMGGPYRSDDGGKTWRPLFAAFGLKERQENDDMVRDLNVDPRNADSLIVASGNRRDKPGGIFVTRDGGRSFRKTATFTVFGDSEHSVHGPIIARNPHDPDELFAGEDADGLFHSTDNGETWKKVGDFSGHWITHLRYDKSVAGRIWLTAPKPQSDFRRRDVERKIGFYRSDDNGCTWVRLPVETPPYRLAQASRDPGMIASWLTCFKRSTDGGMTWTDYSEGLPELTEEKQKAFFLNDATFWSLDAGVDFYLTAPQQGNLYRRDLGENRWRVVPRQSAKFGCPESEDHMVNAFGATRMWCRNSFTVDPTDPAHWFSTDWYDVWETTDAGANWTTRVNGMMPLVSFDVKCDPNDPNRILYGVADVEMLYSKDGGRRFYRPKRSNPYANCLTFSHRTKHLVAGCGGNTQTLSISSDGGITWKWLADKPGLPRKTKWHEVFAYGVAFDPLDDALYAIYGGPIGPGGGGVYRSRNGGETWTFFSAGLPCGQRLFKDFKYTDGPPNQLVFSSDGSGILRAPKTGRFYRLDRPSERWVELPYDGRESVVPIPDPFVPGRFLLPGRSGVRESLDGGLSFHPYLSVPEGPTTDQGIAFDPHRRGRVALATYASVCLSDDGGKNWRVLEGGLDIPTGFYRRIVIDRDRLFFITNGAGVWMRKLEGQPSNRQIRLEGSYPGHLQDVWMENGTIWWAHTQFLVKTDATGRILTKKEVGGHHAGLEVKDGRLYSAVCAYNGEPRNATTPQCHVMVGEYDSETLERIAMHVLNINDRAGSFCILEDGTYLIGCLRHPSLKPSEVKFHHVDRDFKLIKTHIVDVGIPVKLGIEVIRRHASDLYLFIYGGPVMKLDAKTFAVTGRYKSFGGQLGFVRDGDFAWIGEPDSPGAVAPFVSWLTRKRIVWKPFGDLK